MDKPLWMWAVFLTVVVLLLAFDLGVLNKKGKEKIGIKESLWLSLFYFLIACAFGGWVWQELGSQSGKEYFTGYFIEKSLSLDNVFVISLVFGMFAIPPRNQYRVLFWGILGALFLRGIMIALGVTIVSQFYWVLYIFAAFLVFTGIKMLLPGSGHNDLKDSKILKFLKKHIRCTEELHGQKFRVKLPSRKDSDKKVWHYTPLFIAFAMIMFIDLIFAVDSVPAIFAITNDTYIIYTSNIFAVLGLRALYFALAAIIHRFHYLKYSLALVLIFIGSKIFIADLLGLEKFPASISLGVTVALIAGGVILSLVKTAKKHG
jgi:tellurite resistance protein TerC